MRSRSNRLTRSLALGAATLVALAGLTTGEPASAAPPPSPVSAFLAQQLPGLTGTTTVLVHGTTLATNATAMSVARTAAMVKGSVGVTPNSWLVSTRLAALEDQLSGEDPPDLPALRAQVRQLRQLVGRGRGI